METKHSGDWEDFEEKEDDLDFGESESKSDAPAPEVIALREGYNQTYFIQSSNNHLHDILFRCGNWCYTGRVDLGGPDIGLADLQVVIPALQKQQGSLQFLCEWKKMPHSSPYAKPLEVLYDAFDFIGNELISEEVENAVHQAAQVFSWVDDDDAKNYFELQTDGYDCFEKFDIIASKTFVRGLVFIVIYFQRSFFVLLQDGEGTQPLLDVRFPDLTEHLQGLQLQKYDDHDIYQKLLLWQSVKQTGTKPVPKALKVECKDITGSGYTQTFLIRETHADSDNNLREVLFRFGNWCYNGHVDLGPRLELKDIPIIIPMLRRQQSALTFMCEATKMPSTSLFAVPMMHLAEVFPAFQEELLRAEQTLSDLSSQGTIEGVGDIRSWLEDDTAECFFELAVDPCPELEGVEAIAQKVYLADVVVIMLYYHHRFYVIMQDGTNEQPLLDTRFPDVSCQSSGFQVATYRKGVKSFPELRRISLWRAGDPGEIIESGGPLDRVPAEPKIFSTKDDRPKEIKEEKKASGAKAGPQGLGKMSLPHHIAPLKTSGDLKNKLKSLGDPNKPAPWDKTGRPLGAIGSRK